MRRFGLSLYISLFWFAVALVGVAAVWRTQDFVRESASVINGKLSSSYEKYYNENLPIRNFAVSFWAAIHYVVFHEGNKGVVVGKQGVLFTDEEFYEPEQSGVVLEDNIRYMESVEQQMRERNVPLYLTLVPAKADIYDEWLGDRKPTAFMQHMFISAADELEQSGLSVIDLRSIFLKEKIDNSLFLKTDTHWTPAGADIAARQIATVVEPRINVSVRKTFQTRTLKTTEHRGDLLNYLPLEPFFSYLEPAKDGLDERETVEIADAVDAADSLGLFDEVAPGVALVGTSYSADQRWNFEGALKQYLSADVYNYATRGEGPFKPMQDYLASDEWQSHPPEVVIWEVPVRYLVASN